MKLRFRNHAFIKGFSLIETSVALVVIGVITVASLQAFNSANYYKNQTLANNWLTQSKDSVIQFAKTNYRLPCPDIDADGFENCSGTQVTGSLPVHTLGLPVSSQVSDLIAGHQNVIYGVFRDSANNADLTTLAERTGDALGDAAYQSVDDFKVALVTASALATSSNQPYITGDAENTGAEDCTNNVVTNGAFWLASSSGQDANGDGNPFDGVNASLAHNGSGSLCFSAPTKRQDANYIDRVSGVAFSELLGLL